MNWIRESNLIECVDDPREDRRSLVAWRWLLHYPVLTTSRILNLHGKIMKNHLGVFAGKFRECDVSVGGRECPPWQSVPRLHSQWIFDHYNAETVDGILRAHVAWERIHPFIDGNGRTGRMIMNFQRVKAGMKPLCIEAAKRHVYYKWFGDSNA